MSEAVFKLKIENDTTGSSPGGESADARRGRVLGNLYGQKLAEEQEAERVRAMKQQHQVLMSLARQRAKEEERAEKERLDEARQRNKVLSSLMNQRNQEEQTRRDKFKKQDEAVKTQDSATQFMAVQQGAQRIVDAIGGTVQDAKAAGNAGKALANNELAIGQKVDDYADHVERSDMISGPVKALVIRTLAAPFKEAGDVVQAFADRGRALGMYSGAIAGASANADVSRQLADINEANRMGESYAKLIEQQSRGEMAIREMLLPIKEFLLTAVTKWIEWAMDAGGAALEGMQAMVSLISQIPGVGDSAFVKRMNDTLERMKDALEGQTDEARAKIAFRAFDDLYERLDKIIPDPAPPGGGQKADDAWFKRQAKTPFGLT